MFRICRFSLVFLFALATLPSWASSTYTVGQCVPNVGGFLTITDALTYHPPPTVVKVCPGTYNEQIEITNPVTLEGISDGTTTQVIIAPQGFLDNAYSLAASKELAAVVFVNGAAGPVNISNITVDGSGVGNLDPNSDSVGVLYQNTPGSVKGVTVRNFLENAQLNVRGVGIWLEGGPASPEVTVESCSIHDFDFAAVYAALQLNLTATQNDIHNPLPVPLNSQFNGFSLGQGLVTTKISENTIQGVQSGIGEGANLTGTISHNTVIGAQVGISVYDDGFSVTGNEIIGAIQAIQIGSAVSPIKGNTITGAQIGMHFDCIANPNVYSNTFIDSATALFDVPDGLLTKNSYFSVGTIRTGGC
jgi:Periplasmic copper-binding protein (NosD)